MCRSLLNDSVEISELWTTDKWVRNKSHCKERIALLVATKHANVSQTKQQNKVYLFIQ